MRTARQSRSQRAKSHGWLPSTFGRSEFPDTLALQMLTLLKPSHTSNYGFTHVPQHAPTGCHSPSCSPLSKHTQPGRGAGRPLSCAEPQEWRSESSSPQRLFVLLKNPAPVCWITLQLTSGGGGKKPDTSGEGVGCVCHTHTRAFTRLSLPPFLSLMTI